MGVCFFHKSLYKLAFFFLKTYLLEECFQNYGAVLCQKGQGLVSSFVSVCILLPESSPALFAGGIGTAPLDLGYCLRPF